MSRPINRTRRRFLGMAALAAGAVGSGRICSGLERMTSVDGGLFGAGSMPGFDGATAWLNSPPLTAAGLRGTVVLVNFWTYTCINWLRSSPYVRAWYDKYRDQGLVVIGVHTPEFAFEQDLDNVRRAVGDRGITYPVALDNDYAIWRRFDNHYWPALYLTDSRGRLRHQHFGEGGYPETERAIQRALAEAGRTVVSQDPVSVEPHGAEAAADWDHLRSPESYVGHERAAGFASPGGVVPNTRHHYATPPRLALNHWALAGYWTMRGQAAVVNESGGRIAYRFHARDLHTVMGASARASSVRCRLRLDGQPPGAAGGTDVDAQGVGVVAEPRLYQLLRQQPPIVDRQLDVEFLDAGVDVFAFTFG